ncbi:hypothetical protein Ahy_B06g084640 isoform A [Arachis hypogaea]|uniref:DUF4283 domain-containing protein n=1 Tax=Arachis hypogaea TaxID=3818 RepID=A0A444YSE8_ARAHY|nr:hypothetical protein Ahy_B06g084640 isoform A [Arachis hypogaea]
MAQPEDQSIEGDVGHLNPEYDESFIEGNLNMVEKIISDKEVSFNTCKAALLGIWGNPEGVAISEVGRNKFLISFRNASKGVQIRKGRPWSIRGNLVNLQIWNNRQSVYDVDHKTMKLWVQIHGLPLHYLTTKSAEITGKRLGIRTFLRVKVTLNVTKPLPTGFWVARENFQDLWVDFKYERIQDSYCLNCEILESNGNCMLGPLKPRYGPGLGVNRAKAISTRGVEQRVDEENRVLSEDKQAGGGVCEKLELPMEELADGR